MEWANANYGGAILVTFDLISQFQFVVVEDWLPKWKLLNKSLN